MVTANEKKDLVKTSSERRQAREKKPFALSGSNRMATSHGHQKLSVDQFTARILVIREMQKEIRFDSNGKLHEICLTAAEIAARTGLPRHKVSALLKIMPEVKPYMSFSRKYRLIKYRPLLKVDPDES